MRIKILTEDRNKTGIEKNSEVFVSKTKEIGDVTMYGVKSPDRGIVWFSEKEVQVK